MASATVLAPVAYLFIIIGGLYAFSHFYRNRAARKFDCQPSDTPIDALFPSPQAKSPTRTSRLTRNGMYT